MKSLHNNETPQSALGGKERRNVAGFLSIQSNEIYDYGAKVEWGSIDHRGSRVKRSFFRFRKKKGGNWRRFYWRVLRAVGHVKPQGRAPCNPFSGCPGGSHARRLPTRSVFCRFSDANLLALLLRVVFDHFIPCDVSFLLISLILLARLKETPLIWGVSQVGRSCLFQVIIFLIIYQLCNYGVISKKFNNLI